jgi:uncharacterized protein (DUF1778 family)
MYDKKPYNICTVNVRTEVRNSMKALARTRRNAKDAKAERLELRTSSGQAAMIRQAASVTEKTVTAFVLDAATLEAHRALADRRFFRLDPVRWQRFVDALDRPTKEKPRLRGLMRQPSALE